jgi:hypothetical protein
MSSSSKRLARKKQAAEVLEAHTGPVMEMLASVVGELSEECEGLSTFEADLQYAGELSYRLDKAIQLGDPIAEALDGIITFFVALAAIGIWRAVARKDKLRGAKLDRLKSRLVERGPKMAPAVRKRIQRRISRLERAASA